MASNVLPVSIIKQRMNQDAANYLLGNEPVSIDMRRPFMLISKTQNQKS